MAACTLVPAGTRTPVHEGVGGAAAAVVPGGPVVAVGLVGVVEDPDQGVDHQDERAVWRAPVGCLGHLRASLSGAGRPGAHAGAAALGGVSGGVRGRDADGADRF